MPDSIDADFERHHKAILQNIAGVIDDDTADDEAKKLTKLALSSGDQLMLACLFARFDDYLNAGRVPPNAMLVGISEAFSKFRSGMTMDEAFGLKKQGRGKPASYLRREIARTHAAAVAALIGRDETLEVACEMVAENKSVGHGFSESQIKRNYLKYKKTN